MKTNRDRLNKIEGIGFYFTMIFASLVIGFSILGLLVKIYNI
jgi:hypothetical protein